VFLAAFCSVVFICSSGWLVQCYNHQNTFCGAARRTSSLVRLFNGVFFLGGHTLHDSEHDSRHPKDSGGVVYQVSWVRHTPWI